MVTTFYLQREDSGEEEKNNNNATFIVVKGIVINMTNHRIKFITSPNLSSLELEVNNWLKEEMNIHIRQMSLYTHIDGYEMALMIWYDDVDAYTKEEKQQKTRKNDMARKGLEKVAKISSART
jgi:hypothetical protein